MGIKRGMSTQCLRWVAVCAHSQRAKQKDKSSSIVPNGASVQMPDCHKYVRVIASTASEINSSSVLLTGRCCVASEKLALLEPDVCFLGGDVYIIRNVEHQTDSIR